MRDDTMLHRTFAIQAPSNRLLCMVKVGTIKMSVSLELTGKCSIQQVCLNGIAYSLY